jgi:SAM-dependent methyltransferase
MSYELFARYFDAAVGDRAEDITYLKRVIQERKPEAKNLLDLGFGTGEVLAAFSGQYKLAGLDNSPEMLAQATRKVPEAALILSDITSFNLGRQFDIILCTGDTINHLLDWAQWRSLFESVQQHLNVDGVFVFDMNTPHKFERLCNGLMNGHEADGSYFMTEYAKSDQAGSDGQPIYDCNVKVFEHEPSNEFLLHEEHITETTFPVEQVRALAEEFFLQYVVTEDPYLGAVTEQSNRVYFVCK